MDGVQTGGGGTRMNTAMGGGFMACFGTLWEGGTGAGRRGALSFSQAFFHFLFFGARTFRLCRCWALGASSGSTTAQQQGERSRSQSTQGLWFWGLNVDCYYCGDICTYFIYTHIVYTLRVCLLHFCALLGFSNRVKGDLGAECKHPIHTSPILLRTGVWRGRSPFQ